MKRIPRITKIGKRDTTEGRRRHLVYCPGYLDEFKKWNTGYFCPTQAVKQNGRPSDCCSSAKLGQVGGQGPDTPCFCCCRRSVGSEFFAESSYPTQRQSQLREIFGQYSTPSYDEVWNWKAVSNEHDDFELSAMMDNDAKYRSFMACFLSLGLAPLLLLLCFIVFITLHHFKYRRSTNRKPSDSRLFVINVRKHQQSDIRPISEFPNDTAGCSSLTPSSSSVGRAPACSGPWSRVPFISKLIGQRNYAAINSIQSEDDNVIAPRDSHQGNASVFIDNKTSTATSINQQCNCRFKWLHSRELLWEKIALYVKNILHNVSGYAAKKQQINEQV